MNRSRKTKSQFIVELKQLLAETQNNLAQVEKSGNSLLEQSITYDLIFKNFKLGSEGLKGIVN